MCFYGLDSKLSCTQKVTMYVVSCFGLNRTDNHRKMQGFKLFAKYHYFLLCRCQVSTVINDKNQITCNQSKLRLFVNM